MGSKNNKKKKQSKQAPVKEEASLNVRAEEDATDDEQEEPVVNGREEEEVGTKSTEVENIGNNIPSNQANSETGGQPSMSFEAERIKELETQVAQLTIQIQQSKQVIPITTDNSDDDVKHTNNDEVEQLRLKLKETEEEKDKIEVQYDQLLNRIGSMKSVFSKMKENQVELDQAQEQLAEYEKQNLQLKQKNEHLLKDKLELEKNLKLIKEESESLNLECDRLSHDLTSLRKENEIKESSWSKEKKSFDQDSGKLQKELDLLKEQNEEYLITLENEKLIKSSLNNEITELNEKINEVQAKNEQLASKNSDQESKIESLRLKIQELELESKTAIESFNLTSMKLKDEVSILKIQNNTLSTENSKFREDLKRFEKLEQDLKEKQLQIGKLRHEAVILNEHLTKALQLIKRNSSSETVDKELVTNLFISFLNIPRGDTKKFEVLQLIANFLNWDEEKKIQAGLTHAVDANKARQSSRESFVSLWTEYLEKESSSK